MENKEQKPVVADSSKLFQSLSKGRTQIGIDIGNQLVSVAQSALYRGKLTLIKVASGAIVCTNERDRDQDTVKALKSVLAGFNTKKADIICVLPSRYTMVETLLMPLMPEGELVDAVNLEISSSQHFNIEDPVIDQKLVAKVFDKGTDKLQVIVVAVAKAALNNLLSKFIPSQVKPLAGAERSKGNAHSLGLELSALIPMSIAIENIIRKSTLHANGSIAIMEIGTLSTELNIYRNSRLEFSRQIPVSGFDITRSLTGALFTNAGKVELTIEEAEELKRTYGIPLPDDDYIVLGKIHSGQILSLMRPKLEQFSGEIFRSLDSFYEKTGAGKIDRLIIFGGGARLKGLPEFLSAELGIAVQVGNPVEDIEVLSADVLKEEDDLQRYVQSIGASLADLSGINLLPEFLRDRKALSFQKLLWGAAVVLMSVAGILSYTILSSMESRTAKELAQVQREYDRQALSMQKLKNDLIIRQLVESRLDWANIFRMLSNIPSDMYLVRVELKDGRLFVTGFTVGKAKDIAAAPAQLVTTLQSGGLVGANLVSKKSDPGNVGRVNFEVEAFMPGREEQK